MANMSYCAFENTANDLYQCLRMLYDAQEGDVSLQRFIELRSSKEERRAVERLISLAEDLVELTQRMDHD